MTLTNGTGGVSATLKTAGNQTITATDTVTASITGSTANVPVAFGTLMRLMVSAPATAAAGTAFNFTVTAQDAFNNTVTTYPGTLHFSGTDTSGVLPANTTLPNGAGTFPATFKTLGPQAITVTDTVTATITGTSGTITVTGGPARRPEYLVIGDGPCRPGLERLAGELGVADRVRFLGQLPNPEAVARAATCDLFVMPGVEEPFGVAFVEAMAAGLPAIGGRGEGGPEDIAAAGPGMVLVEPGDAAGLAAVIDRMTTDRDELRRLGFAARETVAANFTWERCGVETVSAYRAALDKAPPSGAADLPAT